MSEPVEAGPQQQTIKVDERFVIQALESELAELRHRCTMLTALVNQQQEQINSQGQVITSQFSRISELESETSDTKDKEP